MGKIEYNSIISKKLHGPRSSEGFVLYPKTEGKDDDTRAEASVRYKKEGETSYNSATNIRRIFITGSRVVVQYYATPETKNKNGKHHWIERKLNDENNMFDIARKIASYDKDFNDYQRQKQWIDKNAKEPDKYSVSGNCWGILTYPYTCNNVEEIYFDWTFLLSRDNKPFLGELALYSSQGNTDKPNNLFYMFLDKKEQSSIIENNAMLGFMSNILSGGDPAKLRKSFPRLRTVAMISKLDAILEHASVKKPDLEFNSVKESRISWFDANKALIQQSNSVVFVSNFKSEIGAQESGNGLLWKPNKNFKLQGYYKFEVNKLQAKFDEYTHRITAYNNEKYLEQEEKLSEELEKSRSDIERVILKYEKETENSSNKITLRNLLQYCSYGMSRQDKERVVRESSKEIRSRIEEVYFPNGMDKSKK